MHLKPGIAKDLSRNFSSNDLQEAYFIQKLEKYTALEQNQLNRVFGDR